MNLVYDDIKIGCYVECIAPGKVYDAFTGMAKYFSISCGMNRWKKSCVPIKGDIFKVMDIQQHDIYETLTEIELNKISPNLIMCACENIKTKDHYMMAIKGLKKIIYFDLFDDKDFEI